jgi:hypothetical protein
VDSGKILSEIRSINSDKDSVGDGGGKGPRVSYGRILLIIIIVLSLFLIAGVIGAIVNCSGGFAGTGIFSGEKLTSDKLGNAAASNADMLPTPIVAKYEDVKIHNPIKTRDLTEILFHQASYGWAVVMETKLEKAGVEETAKAHGTGFDKESATYGDNWFNGKALHVWRTKEVTEMNTSIDCGARAGSQVYSPVDGKVFFIRTYLYDDVIEDYEIHIQPTGRKDLDVVVLHTYNLQVSEGDNVVAGRTPLSYVRDISSVGSVQLKDYTAKGDPGNHAHVQINDRNRSDYKARLNKLMN